MKNNRGALDNQTGGDHYRTMKIQPVEFIHANNIPFMEGNIIKYASRHKNKGGAKDVRKIIHFSQLVLQLQYRETDSKPMTLNEYQAFAETSAVYPILGYPIVYPALGLAGEAGEVAEKVKKLCRDHGGIITDEIRNGICKELGDVLWYVSETARQAGLTLEEVAATNMAKLNKRQDTGTLYGEGDDRENGGIKNERQNQSLCGDSTDDVRDDIGCTMGARTYDYGHKDGCLYIGTEHPCPADCRTASLQGGFCKAWKQ